MQVQVLFQTLGSTENLSKKLLSFYITQAEYKITSTMLSQAFTTVWLILCKFNKNL